MYCNEASSKKFKFQISEICRLLLFQFLDLDLVVFAIKKCLEESLMKIVLTFFPFRTMLENPLNKNTYQKKFSMLMNIEELQMEVDIRRYDMKDAPMTKRHNLLLLEVRVHPCTWLIHVPSYS